MDECDFGDEMAELARCDVLLSPSERDAQIIRARLPQAKVINLGISSDLQYPPFVSLLAQRIFWKL